MKTWARPILALLFLLPVISPLLAGDDPKADAAHMELQKLEGTWQLFSLVVNGQDLKD